jgi:hypothetical protein
LGSPDPFAFGDSAFGIGSFGPNAQDIQFVQSLNNQGWSIFRGMPIYTGDVWNGDFYFGSMDGNVYIIQGDSDGQPRTGFGVGVDIVSDVLGSFQDMDEPAQYHQGVFVRPVFLAGAQPAFQVVVRYDYNISEVFPDDTSALPSGVLWDLGIWDLSLWAGDFLEVEAVRGVSGIGRAMAIGMSMSTSTETTLIRYDLMYQTGGLL